MKKKILNAIINFVDDVVPFVAPFLFFTLAMASCIPAYLIMAFIHFLFTGSWNVG